MSAQGNQNAPLSHAQARMLLAEQMSPAQSEHVLVSAYLVRGPLQVDILRAALSDVARRHPVLRTTYTWTAQMTPVQRVRPDPQDVLEVVPSPDGCEGATPDRIADLLCADWWDEPFALETSPPVRARLAWIDDDLHVLCHAVHHIAFDEWSARVFRRDLATAYAARAAGGAPLWHPVSGYPDYAAWERQQVAGWLAQDLPFWRDALRDAGPLTPRGGGGGEGPAADSVIDLDANTVQGFLDRCGPFGRLPLTLLLFATAEVLRDHRIGTGIGTLFSNRVNDAYRSAVGCFVNPVVVPISHGSEGIGARLGAVARTTLECLHHGRTPIDEIVRRLRSVVPGAPWHDSLVFLHDGPMGLPGDAEVEFERLPVRAPRTSVNLVVEGMRRADGSWLLRARWRDDGDVRGAELLNDVASLIRDLRV